MEVTIDLKAGKDREPTQADMEKNIVVIEGILFGRSSIPHHVTQSLSDTLSILRGIQKQLPER